MLRILHQTPFQVYTAISARSFCHYFVISLAIVFFILLPVRICLGFNPGTSGGRSAAMGNASVALVDFWSIQNNQAGLAYVEGKAAGIYYENRFMIKELGYNQVGLVVPVPRGTAGISVSYFGFDLYNEIKLGLAYAMAWSEIFATGLQLDYIRVAMGEQYGNRGIPTFEVGILTRLSRQVTLGAHIFNPVHVRLSQFSDERIPSCIRLGIAWQIEPALIFCMEAQKESHVKPDFRTGAEYKVTEHIYVRGGLATNPATYAFGCGFLLFGHIRADFAASIHSILGFTPQISLIYEIDQKK